MLNTSVVGMSGAVTSTTTVPAVVPDRSAVTRSAVSTEGGGRTLVGSRPKHDPMPRKQTTAAASALGRRMRLAGLGGNLERRAPGCSLERGDDHRVASALRRHES